MENSPKGPYKHYERPKEPRSSVKNKKRGTNGYWRTIIALLIIILIVLVPIVHHLSTNNHEQAQEVERVKKSSSKKNVTKSKASTKIKQSTKSSSQKRVKTKSKTRSTSTMRSALNKQSKIYVVQEGDTLTSIAQKNNLSVAELARINGISDTSNVDAGQTLKLN